MTATPYSLLSSLGNLRVGYSVRRKKEVLPENATHWLIPIRAVSREFERIDWSALEPTEFEQDDSRYLLRDGDVLILVRGATIAIAVERPPDNVIVHNNLAIFSPRSILDGKYFAWWFNHPQTQKRLSRLILGSSQSFFPFSELKKLQVPVPSMEKQSMILTLHHLRQREKELTQKLEEKREQLSEALIFKLLETKEN